MKALTVWQPWAWAIVVGFKPIENRTWHPPRSALGQPLAIHAGKRKPESQDEIDGFVELLRRAVPEDVRRRLPPTKIRDLPFGAIVGVARLVESVTASESPWFNGPVGWGLAQPLAIDPIPCRGAQGLWDVPPEIAAQIAEQWRAHAETLR